MIAGNGYLNGGLESSADEKEITTRKILLEIENHINNLFKKHLQNTPQSIFVLDWSLDIIYMNPAFQRLTGFRKEDMASRQVKFSVHPNDRDKIESSTLMAIVGKTTQRQCRVRVSNGSFHSLTLRFSPLRLDERCLVLCIEPGCSPEDMERPDRE
jgi:PAS domain S-box-containing protein